MTINRSVPFSPTSRALLVAASFVASSVLIHLAVMQKTPFAEWLALASLVFVPLCIGLAQLRLIATVALAARPATPDYLLHYSRRLTQLWAGIFAAMALWDLSLALLAPHGWWSFMANCANYLVVGATVVLEYLFRRARFRSYEHPGFAEYLKIVVRADPRRIRGE